LITAVSVAGALTFYGLQVNAGAEAQRQAKLTSELQMLTQLQSAIGDSVYGRVRYRRQFRELRAGRRAGLSPAAYRQTSEEAALMDYLAWLLDHRYVTTGHADRLWGAQMVCEYQQAFAPAFADPAHELPDLVRFIQRRGRQLSQLVERC